MLGLGLGLTQLAVRRPVLPVTGNVLPTAALNDIALTRGTTYGNQHVVMNGGVSLPAGDWVMHIACRILSHSYEVPLINIAADAAPAQGYLSSAPNLLLAYIPPGSSRSADPARGAFILSGRDNAGNWLSPQSNRSIANYWEGWGSGVRYLSGPYNGSVDSNAFNSIFIQKKGGRIELWIVSRYSTALLADFAATSFGELTGGAAVLGRIMGNGHRAAGFVMQRFFSAGGSLTPRQMEGIAQGVDPRQYLAFDQPTDILTAITQLGTAEQPHLVGAGSCQLSASGTADYTSAATRIIPTAVDPEMPRISVEKDQVFQRTGVSSDLRLEARVTGVDDDIYVQIVDWTTKTTVVKPFALLGRSVNGAVTGTLTEVPSALQWYDMQVRKGLNGPVYTVGRRFGVGIVLDWWGQSIAEKMRSSTQTTISSSSAASGFLSFFSRAKSDSGSTQGIQNRGWKQTNTQGYGEVHTARMIAEAAQCPVGGVMSAMEGSGIDAWQRGATSAYIPASDTWQRTRPGYMVWSQGQGSTGMNPAGYRTFLNTLLQQTREDFPWAWKLIMEPLNNNGAIANNAGAFTGIRNVQSDWADDNASARLSNAGGFVDLKLSDTVHASLDAAGQGRIAERIARQVLWMEGVVPTSARGPRITAATRSGAVIDLTVAQNGGTGLRTPNAADITGFRASTSSTFASLLTISSAVVVDATTIRLTLAADPGAPVYVDYQWGNPGATTTPRDSAGFIPAVSNPVYDDRSPGMNAALGFPVQFTTANLLAA